MAVNQYTTTDYMFASNSSTEELGDEGYNYYYSDEDIVNLRAAQLHEMLTQPTRLIALIFGFFALVLNTMSLLAMSQIKNRITAHHRLIISLAISDMLIGITVILHFIVTVVNVNYRPGHGPPGARLQSWCIFMVTKALNSTVLNSSLLNLMCMAIDHYMAIMRPLHYPSQMSRQKSSIMIIVLWTTSILLGFSQFLPGMKVYERNKSLYNYCEATYKSLYQDEYVVFGITLITSLIMIFIYTRIYIKIKMHRIPGERQTSTKSLQRSSVHKDIRKNKRALITTLLILGTFMICWLPNCLYQIALLIQVAVDKSKLYPYENMLMLLDQCFLDLVVVNSITDPIIYAVRMFDVQLGYRRLVHKCFPRLRLVRNTESLTTTKNVVEKRCSQVEDREMGIKLVPATEFSHALINNGITKPSPEKLHSSVVENSKPDVPDIVV